MRARRTMAAAAAALAAAAGAGGGAAQAAGPGETFLVGGLTLPAGAIAGGSGGAIDGEVQRMALSDDGRYAAFVATADALAPDAALDGVNVFRKDRVSGEIVLVNRATGSAGAVGNGFAAQVAISDDGSRVAFVTDQRLDPSDLDDDEDVYVRDVPSATTYALTADVAGDAGGADLSGDGAWVSFATAARVVADDANGNSDVYRRAVTGGAPALVSKRAGAVAAGNGSSYASSISDDGRWVAFESNSTDLVSGYAGSGTQIFVRDMRADTTTTLVSNAAGLPRTAANGDASEIDIAGRPGTVTDVVVAFDSYGTDLTADDTEGDLSVFRKRFSDGSTTLVSRATGPAGASASSRAHTPSISDDGTRVAFTSDAPNLGAGDDYYGVYVRDLTASTTVLGSADNRYAVEGALSGDGGVLAWYEQAGFAPGGDPDLGGVLTRSYATPPAALGAVELASRPPGGAPFLAPVADVRHTDVGQQTISADGRFVVFETGSSLLPGGGPETGQVYRRDTLTGETVLISRADGPGGAPSSSYAAMPTISADGNRVAFTDYGRLDPAAAEGGAYVRDVAAGTTRLVSRADGVGGAPADRAAEQPRISADGRYVTFGSEATNLGAPVGVDHVFRRGVDDGTTIVIDRADGADGAIGDGDAREARPSGDGSRVLFISYAKNLSPDDATASDLDVYLRDVASGSTTLVSRRPGLTGAKTTRYASTAVLSADGRTAVFRSDDELLAPEAGGWNGRSELVARDLASGANTLVSRAPGGAPADQGAGEPAISADGSVIAFTSGSANLLPGLGGEDRSAVFVRQSASGALSGPPQFGLPGAPGHFGASGASLSGDGQCLAFDGFGHNAISGAGGDFVTAYVYVVSGSCPKPLPVERREQPQPPRRAGRPAVKPALSKVSLLRTRFRVGRGATALTAAASRGGRKKPRRTPAGSAIRFTLNARANVTFAVERNAGRGRLVGRSCRRATRKLRKKRACTRWTSVGALKRNGVAAGRQSVAFSGRLGRRALAPGRYRLTVKAANVAGSSKPATLAFTVVRR